LGSSFTVSKPSSLLDKFSIAAQSLVPKALMHTDANYYFIPADASATLSAPMVSVNGSTKKGTIFMAQIDLFDLFVHELNFAIHELALVESSVGDGATANESTDFNSLVGSLDRTTCLYAAKQLVNGSPSTFDATTLGKVGGAVATCMGTLASAVIADGFIGVGTLLLSAEQTAIGLVSAAVETGIGSGLQRDAVYYQPQSVLKSPTTAPPTTTTTSSPPTVTLGVWTGVKPTAVNFSADSGYYVTRITWSSWGSTQATGSGTLHTENCIPDCAQGTVTTSSVTLVLSNVVDGRFTTIATETPPFDPADISSMPTSDVAGAS
jgi:hypothetical protein